MNEEILIELGVASDETRGCPCQPQLEHDIVFDSRDEPPIC